MENDRLKLIQNRKDIITNQLNALVKDDFVLAFIPTPAKIGKDSFWDTNSDEILDMVQIWIYDKSENDFIEFVTDPQ